MGWPLQVAAKRPDRGGKIFSNGGTDNDNSQSRHGLSHWVESALTSNVFGILGDAMALSMAIFLCPYTATRLYPKFY